MRRHCVQGGKLAEGLPRALRRAVKLDRVPDDLKPDLLFLAQLLDPLVAKAKAAAPDMPARAREAAKKIHQNEGKAYEVGVALVCLKDLGNQEAVHCGESLPPALLS